MNIQMDTILVEHGFIFRKGGVLMYRKCYFIAVVLSLVVLCGCSNNKELPEKGSNTVSLADLDSDETNESYIMVNGKKIAVSDIVNQIPETINNELYYGGNYYDSNNIFLNSKLFLNSVLDYDLYINYPSDYYGDVYPASLPEIRLVFKGIEHPLSTGEESKLYCVGIKVTETGLESRFFSGYHISEAEIPGTFLGSYSLCINEVVTPNHEQMSDEWKNNAKKALRLYMDENDFWSYEEDNLEIGCYNIYVKGFSENDTNTKVIFEHENGNLYEGYFYFVHHVSGDSPADLNKVILVENVNSESYQIYLERVKENAALTMEHTVYQQPGL